MAQEHETHQDAARALAEVQKLLTRPDEVLPHPLHDLVEDLTGDLLDTEDAVYLMRWNGQPGLLQKWRILDEKGQNLRIRQSMHQVGITQDYILLSDSSFKFTIDLLINNPFPHNPRIDRFLRQLLAAPMLPFLSLYLVNRRDLHPHRDTAPAATLKTPIPLESVHFSANYANPNQEITIYLAHNSAACMAEWLRTYDTLATQPGQPVDPKLLGMFAIGAMDINRIGKFVIDAKTATIREEKSKVLHQTGNPENPAQIGAHTWEMGLYTYRDMIAPDRVVEEIKHMYFISYGLDPRMLSEFIFNLYKDYPNRLIPVEDIRRYSSVGLPPA
ncbi:MAG: hypothetical protein HC913_07015 [Microscillaceae bacterium]|nr:hypothetical protein [Microscillaceae bacterium]